MTDCVHNGGGMDTVPQTVELPTKRQNRRHTVEWKRSVVEQTFEAGASVARVARENNINANQVWAWRKLYAQGLLVEAAQIDGMLPVVVDAQSRAEHHAPAQPQASLPTTLGGCIELQHGKTSVRIEGVPDATVLREVLERVLR